MTKRAMCFLLCLVIVAGFGFSACTAKKDQAGARTGADFEAMMNQLMVSCEGWDQMTQGDKERAIDAIVSLYRVKENVAVLKPTSFYAQRADETLLTNPDLKKLNLPALVRLLAIMEYDYFNGQNKDDLAKKLLGEKMYEANKRRLQLETNQ